MPTEFGLFSDEGLIEGQFYSRREAEAARSERYSPEDGLAVCEICPDHEEFPEPCQECLRDD